jgi:epoxyqueuosine reductase
MLIHPGLGSFLYLAEVLTELALPADPPYPADRCGTCTRCRQACPTGCILPDRTIDSGRCISYLTIEHRGPIPESLRELTGRAVFGCDICQSACPWNRKAAPAAEEAFSPRAHFPIRDMGAEYMLAEKNWGERFRRSPIRRAGRDGYRRNLLIALGNTGREDAVPVLQAAAGDPNPVLKASAEWALGRIKPKLMRNRLFFGLWRVPSQFGRIPLSGLPNHPSFQKVNPRPPRKTRREGENV